MANPLKALTRLVSKNYELDSFTVSDNWQSLNRRSLKQEYRRFVKTCMDVRAQDVAKYQPLFYNQNPRVAKADPLEDHELLQLLDQPSEDLSKYELFELISLSLDTYGVAYVYVALTASGRPALPGQEGYGMTPIDPMRVAEKIYDKITGRLLGYRVNRPRGDQVIIEKNEMLVFKLPEELGIVEANLLYIDTEDQVSTLHNSFLRKSSNPGGVATVKGSITKEAFLKLKKQWKDEQSGAQNAGRTLFIRNGDFTFDKIGLSIADLDIKTLKEIPKQDVREAFRVPIEKLGSVGSSGLGSRAAAETVNYVFTSDVTDNTQLRLDDGLEKWARLVYPKDSLFINHVSQIPEDKESISNIINNSVNNIISKDEARTLLEKLVGINLPQIPNGEGMKYYVPFNLTELGTDTNPVPTPTKGITVRTVTQKALAAPIQKSGKQTFFDSWNKLETHTKNKYEKTFKTLIAKQKQSTLSKLRNSHKALGDDLKSETLAIAYAKKVLDIVLAGYEQGGKNATDYVGIDTEFVMQQATRDSILSSTERLMKSFNEETAAKIQKQMVEGLDKAETLNELSARIEKVYSDAEGSRAERIAQTEAHRACNAGVVEGYKQSDITHMQWVTQGGACEFCTAMEGTITEIDTPFLDQGETLKGVEGGTYDISYTDVQNADLHPYCNCLLIPIDDVEKAVVTPRNIELIKHDHSEIEALQEALMKSESFNVELKNIIGLEDA